VNIVELACAAQAGELQAFAEQVLRRFLSAELDGADVEPVAPV
jgi:hypothetical protein